mmetsp:Transcript_30752/g.65441  ORF Transcript_30752/g.65441 Transcript_30752/m.65441 type:complete len:229 (-) Transcript_30752:56-742(-)
MALNVERPKRKLQVHTSEEVDPPPPSTSVAASLSPSDASTAKKKHEPALPSESRTQAQGPVAVAANAAVAVGQEPCSRAAPTPLRPVRARSSPPALSAPPPRPDEALELLRVPLSRPGYLKGEVRVQWDYKKGSHQVAAANGKGTVSKKGVALSLTEGRLTAATRGLARDVELRRGTVTRILDSFLNEGKATFTVEDYLGGDEKSTSHVMLSKMDPCHLRALVELLRP